MKISLVIITVSIVLFNLFNLLITPQIQSYIIYRRLQKLLKISLSKTKTIFKVTEKGMYCKKCGHEIYFLPRRDRSAKKILMAYVSRFHTCDNIKLVCKLKKI